MKKSRAENEACVLALAWVIAWGIGCYERSMGIIIVASLFVGVLLACSWRKPGKLNKGFCIPTAVFARWYTKGIYIGIPQPASEVRA